MDFEQILELVNQAVWKGEERNLTDPETVILKGTWEGLTYAQMSKPVSKYSENYLMRDVGRDLWKLLSNILAEDVTKSNFRYVMERRFHTSVSPFVKQKSSQIEKQTQIDWGDAPDTSVFYGREKELKILQQWIVKDNCNLVVITGLPQMGKTFLAAELVEQIQNNFDYVIWRSLDKVKDKKLLEDWFYYCYPNYELDNFLKNKALLEEPLIECLRKNKCLLIINDIDKVISHEHQELNIDIEQIITRIGSEIHSSCLLITGQVIPQEIQSLIKEKPRINRLISLSGYTEKEIKSFLDKENVTYKQEDVTWLFEKCQGIPHSLRSRLEKIKALCNNNIAIYRSLTDLHSENETTEPTETKTDIISKIKRQLSETEKKIIEILSEQENKQVRIDKILIELCDLKSGDKNKIEELKMEFFSAMEKLESKYAAIFTNETGKIQLTDLFR